MRIYNEGDSSALSSVGVAHGRLRPTINGYDRVEVDEWNEEVRDDAQREIESAIHHLLISSNKPAVLIDSVWEPDGQNTGFENLEIYRQAASDAGCSIMAVTTRGSGGCTHYLFVATSAVERPQDCLAFLPS